MRPGPAYGLVLLGDPPSFDEDDSDPHCCVKPLDAVALPSLAATAACRSRHGPPASCSAPMVSRLRCLLTVRPGMPPRPPPLPRSPRQPRLRCRTSAVSPRAPRVFRTSRETAACRVWMSVPPAIGHLAHPCPCGCISRPQVHHTRVSCDRGSAPGRRHPRAMDAAPAPDFHRLSGLTSLSGWLPTTPPQGGSNMGATIAPAPKRHQKYLLITLAAAALKADLAPRHYRIPPTGRHAAEDTFGRFRPLER